MTWNVPERSFGYANLQNVLLFCRKPPFLIKHPSRWIFGVGGWAVKSGFRLLSFFEYSNFALLAVFPIGQELQG